MSERRDGRRFAPELDAKLERVDGQTRLLAPRPGLWRDAPIEGALVRPGDLIGELEILGERHRLRAPAGAFGVVGDLPDGRRFARRPVDHGARLMTLDPEGVEGGAAAIEANEDDATSGPVFRTPLGGRFYARPAPDADPFVSPGDLLTGGETVALIEVMKTFNRVKYDGVPAKLLAVAPADGDDIEAGDVLLTLEPT